MIFITDPTGGHLEPVDGPNRLVTALPDRRSRANSIRYRNVSNIRCSIWAPTGV
jgi:hypothetical protein